MNSRKLLSQLYHRFITGKRHWRNLKSLREYQWLPPSELQALCDQRRRDLLAHAAAKVPYYAPILRETGVVDSAGKVNLDNFTRLPLLDKDTIRKQYDELKTTDIARRKDVIINTSGGSTGEPITLLQDRQYAEWNYPAALLCGEWSGHNFGDLRVTTWCGIGEFLAGKIKLSVRWKRWLNHEIFLNTAVMTPENIPNYVQIINQLKPPHILAFAESIYEIAQYIQQEKIQIHSPRSIITSANTLFPYMRQKIQEVFGAPVFNRYGSQEVGVIAAECDRHIGLHVFPFNSYVEILLPDGSPAPPGKTGELVVTLLSNYTMPLIRYRIGDVAVLANKPCPCGRNWPLLKEMKGRITDIFIAANGTHINGQYFIKLLCFRNWIRKFQVVQEEYELVKIFIMLIDKDCHPKQEKREEMAEVDSQIQKTLGQNCRIEWSFVDTIPRSPSGKHLYTISKVKDSI